MNTITLNGCGVTGIRGQILTFKADPFICESSQCYEYIEDGLIIIRDGKIVDVGPYTSIRADYYMLEDKDIDVYDGADSLIMPGFVDCHMHYVQLSMVGSYGDTLLDWLNRYTFPAECMFVNDEFAEEVAQMAMKQMLEHGTTTANIFATTYPGSVDAIFRESERYNTRMIAGKVLQDRNVPEALADNSAEESVAMSEQLLKKWHNRGRQLYAVIPRFAPTSTPEQLKLAGELYQRYIDHGVYAHTHLCENVNEIAWVSELYPENKSYLDVYDKYGLVDHHSVFAHCAIMGEDDWQRLHQAGSSVAHSPSSNLFLGSGQFKYWEAKDKKRPVFAGIATDIGAGTNYSIIRQLGDAYKVAMINTHPIDALKSFYLATRGGAEVLHLADKIGSIAPGYEADIAVLDFKATEYQGWRLAFSDDIFEKLFVIMTLGLDNTNRATYVAGHKVYDRYRDKQFVYPT